MNSKRFFYAHGLVWDTELPNSFNKIPVNDLDVGLRIVDWLNSLNDENCELKKVLLEVLNQLYNAESSLIYEYSTHISDDEKELKELFKEQYSKYGWEE